MTRRGILAWTAAASLLFLSACASTPSTAIPADPARAWQQRVSALLAIDSWEVKAKLAVKTHKRGGQANMLWRLDHEDHSINLYGPLGGGRVILTRNAEGATLKDNRKRTFHAPTPEELLYRVAGWQVPFASMRYWVLGVPEPGMQYEESLDRWGRLQTLTQAGWEIEFIEYRDFDGRELPRKFFMTALPGTIQLVDDKFGDSDEVKVKVIIKRWRL